MASLLGLPKAQLSWSDAGEPIDQTTGDIYFSTEDGAKETKTVFLDGCDLPNRWQKNKTHVICELGFGTGLNFLASMALWQKTARPDQCLYYIAVEGHPMSSTEIAKAHARFPHLSILAQELQTKWPPRVKGFHHLYFKSHVSLTLLFGPAEEMLEQLQAQVDSWFLDGFAPAKNPTIWSQQVFEQIARLSKEQAKIGTYTVAGFVRRGLSAVGFEVEKKPGHGRKRQRMQALFTNPSPKVEAATLPQKVIVIGGGIAGACLSNAFHQAQIPCILIEKRAIANGASGNPWGLVSPRLDLEDTPLARFYRTAFVYACSFYARKCGELFDQTGLQRFAVNKEQQKKFIALEQLKALPSKMLQLQEGGRQLLLPTAGVLQPAKAVHILTKQTKVISAQVHKLISKDSHWIALTKDGDEIERASVIVIATGCGTICAPALPDLKLLRGQVSIAHRVPNLPTYPKIAQSYTIPVLPDQLLFGATHDRTKRINDTLPRQADHLHNLANLAKLEPVLAEQIDIKTLTGRTSYRAASPDMQALAGPVADKTIGQWSKKHWGKLNDYTDAPVHPGLFMLNGLGSRGLTLAPILAEEIVRMIIGAPSILEKNAANALHPARFAARDARKNLSKI